MDASPPPPAPTPMGQHLVFRFRNVLAGLPILVGLAWPARWSAPSWGWWTAAGVLGAAGVLMRAAAVMYCNYGLGKPRVLATRGPYAFTRNPLYVGNGLLIVAATAAAGVWWLPPAAAAWVLAVYTSVAGHEERHLQERFGDDYRAYCERVRRWWPRRRERPTAPARPERPFGPAVAAQALRLVVLVPFVLRQCGWLGRW